MLNRRSLMFSAMLISAMGVGNVWAASCAETDCAALGYTESYNSSGNCLKCPFGDMYNCEAGYICPDNYTQECNGTGEIGVGEACNGKYTECACKEGYNLVDGACALPPVEFGQCNGNGVYCALGDILFSDGTCSANMVSGKTPIAVVVYKSDDDKCGQAMALKLLGNYYWSTEYYDNWAVMNYTTASGASTDFASCENSENIMYYGDSSIYPAVWAAYNYTTIGTKAGDWCLPAAGIFTSYYNNQSRIDAGFNLVGGVQLADGTWSSSEYDNYFVWYSSFYSSNGLEWMYKDFDYEVRPVIEF